MFNRVLCGNVLPMLAMVEDCSVDCGVTSPPYFGLRDYQTEPVAWPEVEYAPMAGLTPIVVPAMVCSLGNEATIEAFVGHLVLIFREVRRVLKDSGTCWVNMGDSYANDGKWGGATGVKHVKALHGDSGIGRGKRTTGLKEKDLCMVPARMALAFQADGWYLRQDIIWAKPNPMPESVTDRCTKSHEYVFLLTKSPRYFYDAAAISEKSCKGDAGSLFTTGKTAEHQQGRASGRPQTRRAQELFDAAGLTQEHADAIRSAGVTDTGKAQVTQDGTGKNTERVALLAAEAKEVLGGYLREFLIGDTRNKRSVWTIPTQGFPGAHFATFPEELARTCILAGCPVGGVVLDPFAGSGTTLSVALANGRDYLGIELNPTYIPLIERRLSAVTPPLNFDAIPAEAVS